MSDELKHECGVSLLRLRKPLEWFEEKYGTAYYGYQKLALLLEKQHNRGQDGAGIACVGVEVPPGVPFYQLEKSCTGLSLADLLATIGQRIEKGKDAKVSFPFSHCLSERFPFLGEIYLGHLRYGTFGSRGIDACQPVVSDSGWRNHTVLLAGNFNLTNTRALFDSLVATGHHPRSRQDTQLLLAEIVHQLEQVRASSGNDEIDMIPLLQTAAKDWDGGYAICGIFGNGDAFALRDPAGIRPCWYYVDDEVAVVASERVAIQTVFNLKTADVKELAPGSCLTVTRDGQVEVKPCLKPAAEPRQCVFERIYFSRGNDEDIHRERRALGRELVPQILDAVDHDYAHTVFSYIPNTALLAYHGMLDQLYAVGGGQRVRFAQIAVKDVKFRTFISDAKARKDLFPHVYDVTYGVIEPGVDNLVVLDDSIVRGNTMRNAILPILDRLAPKRIVVASSAPPIKYPDCYGIDMATFGELVAFDALVSLIHKAGHDAALADAERLATEDLKKTDSEMQNRVKPLYDLFTEDELDAEIARLLKPEGLRADLRVVYQRCDKLRVCCPGHTGDWYFTGNYPTPGGNRVVNRALLNFLNRISDRAY